VRLSPLRTAANIGLLYQTQMIDDDDDDDDDEDDYGATVGMKGDRRIRSTRRKPAPMPICPPQIPHGLIRALTRASAVGSQRITA
jgi:hypothetical protein